MVANCQMTKASLSHLRHTFATDKCKPLRVEAAVRPTVEDKPPSANAYLVSGQFSFSNHKRLVDYESGKIQHARPA